MERRAYLVTVGAIGSVGGAGCSRPSDDGSTTGTDGGEDGATDDVSSEESTGDASNGDSGEEQDDTNAEEGPDEETADATVEIAVDWEHLQEALSDGSQSDTSEFSKAAYTPGNETVTHVGVRIEYPDTNTVFSRAIRRKTGENGGLVSLDVPPVDATNVYITAVRDDGADSAALLFSAENDVRLESGTTTRLTTTDLEWVVPEWFVDPEYETELHDGAFRVDKESKQFGVPLYVTYPFHSNQQPRYPEILVRIDGGGDIGKNTEGVHGYTIRIYHPEIEPAVTEHEFVPYLRGDAFGFPAARYRIGPTGQFSVIWE